jgi:hypothetical protein
VLVVALLAIAVANASEKIPPKYSPLSYQELTSKVVLSDLNGSSLAYDHVVIIGDLNLNKPYDSIKITNSISM